MPEQEGLLLYTDIELDRVAGRPTAMRSAGGGREVLGHFVDVERTRENMELLTSQLNTVMKPLAGFEDFYLDTVELKIIIEVGGKVGIFISEGSAKISGGITVTFKNKNAPGREG